MRALVLAAVVGAAVALMPPSRNDAPEMVNPCRDTSGPYIKMPFCDPTLAIDARVKDAVSRMSISEKIANLGTGGAPIQSLGLNQYNWWSEATHGVASWRHTAQANATTNFAFPITTAMAFNRTLWKVTGRQIAREARALMNEGNAYSTFWAPVINLAREPRWGRNIETPGEDPYLTGEYATEFVQGFQEAPEDPYHVQASACCKHYVANSMDSSTVDGVHHWRNEFDATVSMQDLVDSYMLPFQACVEKGRVSGLMCSYNAVNGVPTCADDWLLTTVARGEWGFDGYVTSDCDADSDVFVNHHFTKTPEESVRDVLRAGTDIDCGGFVSKYAQSALDKKVITEADMDARLEKLFRVRMRLNHFDPVGPLDKIPADTVCSDYALSLSRDGTAQAAALLKNVDRTLPLKAFKRAAVVGPTGQLAQSVAGYYGPGNPCNGYFGTVYDAVKEGIPDTTFAMGTPTVLGANMSMIPAAVKAAKTADVVVLALGTDLTAASEGHDAVNITLSKAQIALVDAVTAAVDVPVIAVTLSAVALDISPLLANKKIGAVLHLGQPSVTAVGAADLLFGRRSPAGRLIQTLYPEAYQNEVSIFDFNMRPGPSAWPRPDCTEPDVAKCKNGTNPGRTHRFYTGKPVLPFGYGLSYTSFKYSVAAAPTTAISLDSVRAALNETYSKGRTFVEQTLASSLRGVSYAVDVTNTGDVDADDAVLGFLVPPGAGREGVPLQTLFGFDRVHVKAGETVTVWLYPALLDLTRTLEDGTRVAHPGEYTVRFGVPETASQGQGYAEHKLVAV